MIPVVFNAVAVYVTVPDPWQRSEVAPRVKASPVTLGLIVNDCCAEAVPPQPPVIVYMMLHDPAATPDTNPVKELTVATDVLLLLQAPVPPPRTTPLAV